MLSRALFTSSLNMKTIGVNVGYTLSSGVRKIIMIAMTTATTSHTKTKEAQA
jgi:hypothetical protein